jgi:SAM-dependent methyltransferase
MDWRSYWDGDHPIYVSERHMALHYRLLARDIIALIPHPQAHVLDHGSGEARAADQIAAKCGRLYLCDSGPKVRAGLCERLGRLGNVRVIAPETLEDDVPDGSLDLVIANSLAQYLTVEELSALARQWLAKLKPGGILVLADIIPPDVGPLTDARALLSFGFKGGFLIAALVGLVRTALSDYRTIRQRLGLTTYTAGAAEKLLSEAGFAAVRRRDNLGHNPARMTFVAQKRG